LRRTTFATSICGIDELDGFAAAGVTHVLSLLDPGWPEPPSLATFSLRGRLDLRFHDIVDALPGLRAPGLAEVSAVLAFGRALEATPDAHLLVHCQKGMSRSVAALTLILAQAEPERPAHEIIAGIVKLRERAWPNLRMIEMGDEALGRGGELVRAAADCYRARLEIRPMLADAMIEMGRSRELELATRGR
jgi:predicted protein tyrosine phosphatase